MDGLCNCQARGESGPGSSSSAGLRQQQYLRAFASGGMNAGILQQIQVQCVWLRLFLIQGHCVLVSINSEINTALQSAPFINGVTHLMRALLTHINLSSRRGPSRDRRQLPAWIYSALACGKPSHSASTFALQEWGSTKPRDSTWAHDTHKF